VPVDFVKAMTFVDSIGPNTPDVTVFFGAGQSITIGTMAAGSNSVYTLPFRPSLYRKVTRIEVNIPESGYISSLEYAYCASVPKTEISIKKYAGPVGACTATGISAGDDLVYNVPGNENCYLISNPNTSDECLYDITLTDPAPKGGIGSLLVTTIAQTLCPGQTLYVPGPTK